MKNIQIIDGAVNATYSIFQATDEEFETIFPRQGQDIEYDYKEKSKYLPASRREIDRAPESINEAERALYARLR